MREQSGTRSLWHRRTRDWVAFDKITLEVVPRYKTSGMSGDEWRTGVALKFWFKGQLIEEEFRTSMEAAIRHLAVIHDEKTCPISDKIIAVEKTKCDQASCSADAVARFKLKRLTADDGEFLDMAEQYSDHYRQFCKQHLRRGDCSREDADDNYEPLDGMGPDQSSNVIESPASFGGFVVLDPEVS